MFWDDGASGANVERDPDEDEPIGVQEEHLYGVVDPPPVNVPNDTFFLDVPKDHDPAAVPDEELPHDDEGVVVPEYVHEREDPTFEVGATFGDSDIFKLAIRQHAIKREFELDVVYSDRTRYRAKCCSSTDCEWFIRATKMKNSKTFMIKEIGDVHTCISTSKITGKMASQAWIADRGKDIMIEEPNIGSRNLQQRLEKKYNVKLGYGKVWNGRQKALDSIHGSWNDSFEGLWRFKAAIEKTNPGSIVDIDVKVRNGKKVFNRLFVALKPCIDGFLKGCRPYLGCDSTFLSGRYTGQLAAATAVDGHNWLFPVACGVFEKETIENWKWFMERLQLAVGMPTGLVIHTDAGKGLESTVDKVFNVNVEHRECFKHLMGNFKKKYRGDIIDKNMWPAAWTYVPEKHQRLMDEIAAESPAAIAYLNKNHIHVCTRSKFSELSKVDYVCNNIAESYNNWIKDTKGLQLDDLVDKIRQMIMVRMSSRKLIADRLEGKILPSVVKALHIKSRQLRHEIFRSGDNAEVSGTDPKTNKAWRYSVMLKERQCTCRQWQVSGKPCVHALAFISSVWRLKVEDFVDDYFSIARFKKAYESLIIPLRDKEQWPKVDLGFNVLPPKLGRSAGRPRVTRIKPSGTGGTKSKQCSRCMGFGHFSKNCKEPEWQEGDSLPTATRTTKKRKRKEPHVIVPSQSNATTSSSQPAVAIP